MSTAPESCDFDVIFQRLHAISHALLKCEDSDIPRLQQLIDEREPLIRQLQALDPNTLSPSQQQTFQQEINKLQANDRLVEAQFQRILKAQAEGLQGMAKSRQALAGYKFPYTIDSSGVENQG